MTDLRDRLRALAADGTDGTQLRRPDLAPAARRARLPLVLTATVAALVAVVGLVVAQSGDDDARDLRVGPAASTTEPTTGVPTTAAVAPSAHDRLVPFINASRTMDAQLKKAAQLINATGAPWSADEARAAAVRAADPDRVAAAIPAGLPASLRDATWLVFSDLVSRRSAMVGFERANPCEECRGGDLVAELRNGSAAAARFASDLASLEEQAKATPPFSPAAPDSRPAAEVAVIAVHIIGRNSCCTAAGGEIFLTAPAVDWTPRNDVMGTPWDGDVDGTPFRARFEAGKWVVEYGAG